ncbi:helix-turn-helix domain-containing protein [Microbacterium sp.]|uniref:helix-turn-helix domain-containing protein n=1 Tax=Microbacterium sp. TaxID=51671 RepID=UPI003C13512A
MTELGIADATPEQRLGRHLRALRRSRGLTLKQLAETASLSHPFLSQLERGLAQPSMASLERLARALGTSRVELFASAERHDGAGGSAPTIVRADEGVIGPYAEGTARMLTEGPRRFEPIEFRGSNPTASDHFVHDEDEFITVIEGSVVVGLGVHGEWTLGPGDSVYCRSGTLHRWRSADGEPYRLIIIKELFGTHTATAYPKDARLSGQLAEGSWA